MPKFVELVDEEGVTRLVNPCSIACFSKANKKYWAHMAGGTDILVSKKVFEMLTAEGGA